MVLELSPYSELSFSHITDSVTIRLFNPSKDTVAAYKVKTTAPKHYVVRPNAGLVHPGSTTILSVTACLQHDMDRAMRGKDKFLIESVLLRPHEVGMDLLALWPVLDPTRIHEHRLRARFPFSSPPNQYGTMDNNVPYASPARSDWGMSLPRQPQRSPSEPIMYTNHSMSRATSPIPHTSPQNVSASMSRASKGLRSLLSPGGRSSSVRNILSTTPSPPPLHSNGVYPPQQYGYPHNNSNGMHSIPTPMRNGGGMYSNPHHQQHHQSMHHHQRPHGMHHADSGTALSMDSMATMTPMGPSDIAPHIRIARLESQLTRAWDEITTNRAALRRLDTQGLVPPMPPLDGFVEDEMGESGYFNGSNPGSFYHGRSGRYGPDGQYLGAQGGMLSGMQGWLVVAIMGVVGMVIGLLMRSG